MRTPLILRDPRKVKFCLQHEYGSLRKAAAVLGIDYFRLSHLLNNWADPKADEIEKIEAAVAGSTLLRGGVR